MHASECCCFVFCSVFQRGRVWNCLRRRQGGASQQYMHIKPAHMKFLIELNVSNAIWIFHSINFLTTHFGRQIISIHFIEPLVFTQNEVTAQFHPRWVHKTLSPCVCVSADIWPHRSNNVSNLWYCSNAQSSDVNKKKYAREMAKQSKIQPKTNWRWFKFSLLQMKREKISLASVNVE